MKVIKRNGREVEYDGSKIVLAVQNAMMDIGALSEEVSNKVENDIMEIIVGSDEDWTVEEISDEVERQLMLNGQCDVAKAYILYRDRQKANKNNSDFEYKYLSKEFLSKYKHLKTPMTELGSFVYYRTYSRYIDKLNRREYWWETVARVVDYNMSLVKNKSDNLAIQEAEKLYDNMFNLRQFPSGRTLFTGGSKASKSYGMSNYNCTFTIIDNIRAYKDMFYLLMVGAGVGFRVLKKDVAKLPSFRNDLKIIHETYVAKKPKARQEYTSIIFTGNVAEIFISDSKEGWIDALYKILELYTDKQFSKVENIIINYNNIRPKGERLKTFGGHSSGYQSMLRMLTKITDLLNNKTDNRLKPIEAMDIANIIGENVVSGGRQIKYA